MTDGWTNVINMATITIIILAFIWAGVQLGFLWNFYWAGLGVFAIILYFMAFTLQESEQTHEMFKEIE